VVKLHQKSESRTGRILGAD